MTPRPAETKISASKARQAHAVGDETARRRAAARRSRMSSARAPAAALAHTLESLRDGSDLTPGVRQDRRIGVWTCPTRRSGCSAACSKSSARPPTRYPLSLNSLRLACNQSTNRDPVVDYDEAMLRDALHRLERRGYTRLASGAGSRAPKYRHLLAEALPMDERRAGGDVRADAARRRRRPGELKQRSERMHAFADLDGVHETLDAADRARAGRAPGAPPGPEGGALRAAARAGSPESDGAPAGRVPALQRLAPERRPAISARRLAQALDDLQRARRAAGARSGRAASRLREAMIHDAPDPRRIELLGHRHRRGHPAGARGGARVVPLALRAAARARATSRP